MPLKFAPSAQRAAADAPSVVFSVRLDPDELTALEARALDANLKPTVLARNLIRAGLGSGQGAELAAAVDRLDAAIGEVRALVG